MAKKPVICENMFFSIFLKFPCVECWQIQLPCIENSSSNLIIVSITLNATLFTDQIKFM